VFFGNPGFDDRLATLIVDEPDHRRLRGLLAVQWLKAAQDNQVKIMIDPATK
jgi:hypothetical protein